VAASWVVRPLLVALVALDDYADYAPDDVP
jgi:hypothetical protein